jgi:deoxyribonuclease-1-like protein
MPLPNRTNLTEIKYFRYLPDEYPDKNLIFCGDFNCPQSHTVFNPLKAIGYKPILVNQKTSLKEKCVNNDCLASEYDNMFYNTSKIKYIKSGVIPFFQNFNDHLKEARKVSDHAPIYFEFSLN